MIDILLSLGTGLLLGLAFGLIGAPVPAPSTLAGVAGILGLTVGFTLIGGAR